MKKLTLLLLLVMPYTVLFAQKNSFYNRKKLPYVRNPQKIDMEEIDERPEDTRDTINYLYGTWEEGAAVLYNGDTLQELPSRFDLSWQQLTQRKEVAVGRTDSLVQKDTLYRTVDFRKIKSFYLDIETQEGFYERKHYVNGYAYRLEGVPVVGIFEVIEGGAYQLLAKIELKTVEPYVDQSNFNRRRRDPVPWREDEPLTRTRVRNYTLFISDPEGNIKKLGVGRRKLLPFFGELTEEVGIYIKKEKLSVRKKEDMINVIGFCNRIYSSFTHY
ncbi:hypothetical protein [Algivirga pacifica]|uniref:GLPGLI family protein n=1 Tax=Algivirga pacifica TaxID=1162670 RepID=A0ABP9DK14_9BACT